MRNLENRSISSPANSHLLTFLVQHRHLSDYTVTDIYRPFPNFLAYFTAISGPFHRLFWPILPPFFLPFCAFFFYPRSPFSRRLTAHLICVPSYSYHVLFFFLYSSSYMSHQHQLQATSINSKHQAFASFMLSLAPLLTQTQQSRGRNHVLSPTRSCVCVWKAGRAGVCGANSGASVDPVRVLIQCGC